MTQIVLARMATVLVLALFVTTIEGHAKLTYPTSWDPAESQIEPCGDASFANGNTLPWAEWVIGDTATVGWYIASLEDGQDVQGQPVMQIETTGNPANFLNPSSPNVVEVTLPMIPVALGDYVLNFTVPDVTCTSAEGVCIVRVWQGSDSSAPWTSCTTVNITRTGTTQLLNPTGGQANCAQAFPGALCPNVNYQIVYLGDYTLSDLNAAVASTLEILDDSNDASTPETAGCNASLTAYVCGLYYQPCSVINTCHDSCAQAVCLCGISAALQKNPEFNCSWSTLGPKVNDSMGPCNTIYNPAMCVPADLAAAGMHGPVLWGLLLIAILSTVFAF